MSLFKNKKKNTNPTIIQMEERMRLAREKKENWFYYAIQEKDLQLARDYFASHYQAIVEASYQTNGIIVYRVYGYKLDF